MSPGKRSGPPSQGPAATAALTTKKRNQRKSTRPRPTDDERAPKVWATYYGPSGRRRWPLLVVKRCPFCAVGRHAHRGGNGLRRAGCCSRQYYVMGRAALAVAS